MLDTTKNTPISGQFGTYRHGWTGAGSWTCISHDSFWYVFVSLRILRQTKHSFCHASSTTLSPLDHPGAKSRVDDPTGQTPSPRSSVEQHGDRCVRFPPELMSPAMSSTDGGNHGWIDHETHRHQPLLDRAYPHDQPWWTIVERHLNLLFNQYHKCICIIILYMGWYRRVMPRNSI